MESVRLSDFEITSIKDVVRKYDLNAEVMLFGSRVDISKKGGDIDLLVFSDKLSGNHARNIRYDLWDVIGEQKIDIIITTGTQQQPFVNLVKKKGVYI